ncbi:MAG: thiamine pyrophosphate-binding protein, partial [Streptosporangiaceae bacterium]
MTGGEALARQLALEGVTGVFGVPGVQLDYAVDGLARVADRVGFFNTRHEQAASYMADGYARSAGDVGVFMVVPGPGLLNAAAGLATAYACSSPVLCVCGQVPSGAVGRGFGVLHEVPDQSGVLRGLTKWSGFAAAPGEVPGLVREAFWRLRSGRPRPVGLEVPPDVLEARGTVDLVQPVGGERVEPDPELVRKAASLLRSARRPVIYAGGGVVAADASEALRALAEALEAPVVVSVHARGALSDRHRLALSSLGGPKVLADADVVLAVGTRFRTPGGRPVATPPAAAVIHLNADPADLERAGGAAVSIHGDASLGLAGLAEHLDGMPPRPARDAELDGVRRWCADQLAPFEPQMSWIRALRAAIPDDGMLVSEFTQVGYVARVGYPVYGPRTYLGPGYQGALGYGFPTALGAKL